MMHIPYETRRGHPADFRVKYRFYAEEEGGKTHFPYQGYRPDYWYAHDQNDIREIFIISPEFEDVNGDLVLENDAPVAQSGTARMWILIPERRAYHKEKIKIGQRGYFMEGPKKVAECDVIEIIGLHTNPVQSH